MTSKMVSDRVESMRAVEGSVEQNAPAVAERISSRLRPFLRSGERMPDLELVARLLGREIESLARAMQDADQSHARELADDAAPRAARDRHAATLREVYTDLRVALSSAYDDEVLAVLRVQEPASANPSELARQSEAVREALLDRAIALPKARRRGARIDRSEFAEELGDALIALQKALAETDRETREADASLVAKTDAIESYDDAFGRVVPALAALYVLAGQDALADKLRLNRRRRGMLEEPEAPAEPASP